MTLDDLLKMKLHEKITPNDNDMKIYRVIGGWIYEIFAQNPDGNWVMSTTFVPEPDKTLKSLAWRKHTS